MSKSKSNRTYDAIVVGTGISGGWAAKELCVKGLKTLVIDRGREVEHGDYPTADQNPWDLPHYDTLTPEQEKAYPKLRQTGSIRPSNQHWFMKWDEQPYEEVKPFLWIRGDQVGGRSITWGRQVYRWNEQDFRANQIDGIAVDWPIGYNDIDPWYDYVEQYIGVSGRKEKNYFAPDGMFMPPMSMNCLEKAISDHIRSSYDDRIMTIGRVANLTQDLNGRSACKYRNRCDRGCPYGAYFCSLSSTLPAAQQTGNMTLLPDHIVSELIYDDDNQKATGVRVINKSTKSSSEYYAKLIFLNASTFGSTAILLNSKSRRFPDGMGNDSGELGHNVMDHLIGGGATLKTDLFSDKHFKGRRANGIYIPRFQNYPDGRNTKDYIRGYQYQGRATRLNWWQSMPEALYGLELKHELLKPGEWNFGMAGHGEMLPYHDNQIYLHPEKKDKYGLPILVMDVEWKENERKMGEDMIKEAIKMLELTGLGEVTPIRSNSIPASAVHEMGTARMGRDPETSILNDWNQIHAVKNVFVTDGSCMTSSSCQNPSLTYMALTARAADYAARQLQRGEL